MAKRKYTKKDKEFWNSKSKQMKQTPLKQKKQIDGRKPFDPDLNRNVKTIDDILGVKTANPFGTTDENRFKESLNENMSLADMQRLATEVGLVPLYDVKALKTNLLRAFREKVRSLKDITVIDDPNRNENLKTSMSKKAHQILSQGR